MGGQLTIYLNTIVFKQFTPPANGKTSEQLYEGYKALWSFWMAENINLVFELAERGADAGYVLTDCFASTPVNQARALSELLNEFFGL